LHPTGFPPLDAYRISAAEMIGAVARPPRIIVLVPFKLLQEHSHMKMFSRVPFPSRAVAGAVVMIAIRLPGRRPDVCGTAGSSGVDPAVEFREESRCFFYVEIGEKCPMEWEMKGCPGSGI
jgi:hypothetical protein